MVERANAPGSRRLFPEQERALAYARRRGTEAPLADIRSRVAGAYAAFEELVAPIPAELARTRPLPTAWCVQEVVDHLVVSERRAAVQLAGLLAGESSATAIAAGLLSPVPLAVEWPKLLGEFREVHARIVGLLDGASDDVPLTATAAVEMVVKCADRYGMLRPVHWIQSFDWKAFSILLCAHNREHIAQVERILAALAPPAPLLAPPSS